MKDPPDRGERGGRVLQATREVADDGLGAGVVARSDQVTAQLEDDGLDLGPDGVRAGARPARARLDRRVAALAVPRDKLIDPASRKVVRPRELARTAPLEHDRVHHVPSQTHRRTPSPAWLHDVLRHLSAMW